MTCPRCGRPLYESDEVRGRGRPRRWCSAECRKLASDERRARARDKPAMAIETRGRLRVAEHPGRQPLPADRDIERVLLDPFSTEKLLRTLTHRIRNSKEQDTSAEWAVERLPHLVAELLRAVDDNGAARVVRQPQPVAAGAPQGAVTTVLSSPRATREVLDALAQQANSGILQDARHHGTVHAARRLMQALFASQTLRPR